MMRIPRHAPEVVAAGARRRFGDDHKIPTTSLKSVEIHGVKIVSRLRKADELEWMRAFVGVWHPRMPELRSIYCDSKVTRYFAVTLHSWSTGAAEFVGRTLAAMLVWHGGHNGVTVCAADPTDPDNFFGDPNRGRFDVDAEWRA
jgi:hypothetical protein